MNAGPMPRSGYTPVYFTANMQVGSKPKVSTIAGSPVLLVDESWEGRAASVQLVFESEKELENWIAAAAAAFAKRQDVQLRARLTPDAAKRLAEDSTNDR